MKVFSIRNFVIWCVAFVIGSVIVFGFINAYADDDNTLSFTFTDSTQTFSQDDDLSRWIAKGKSDWESAGYTFYDFTVDCVNAYLGNYSALAESVYESAKNYILSQAYGEDILIDTKTGIVTFPDKFGESLSEFFDDYGYITSPLYVGFWYNLPITGTYTSPASWSGRNFSFENNVVTSYVCRLADGTFIIASFSQGSAIFVNITGYRQTLSLNRTYVGDIATGYYTDYAGVIGYLGSDTHNNNVYPNAETALHALFGEEYVRPEISPNGLIYVAPNDFSTPVNVVNIPDNNGRSVTINRNTYIQEHGDDDPFIWLDLPEFNNIIYEPNFKKD